MKTLLHVLLCLAATVFGVALSLTVFAGEAEVLFEDDFSSLDAGFGEANEYQSVKDNTLFRKLPAKRSWIGLYQAFVFENADVRVNARLSAPGARHGAAVGIAFWGRDYNDYYTLEVTDAGAYRVSHYVKGRWVFPVPLRKCEPLKSGAEDWTELRVVTLGRHATVYVNGQELISFRGQPPAGGGLIGPYLETGSEEGTAEFSALKVLQPSDAPPDEPGDDPEVLFADDFSALDPAWGEPLENKGIRDQTFFFKLGVEENWKQLYEGRLFDDADIALEVRIVDGDTAASADVAFWCKGYDDLYVFSLYGSGEFAVYRWVKDRWLTPLSLRASEEAKIDPQAWTELRVITQGRKARLYVNGVEVGSITGQPPQGGSQIGLRGQAGKKPCTIEFSSLTVRKPATPQ